MMKFLTFISIFAGFGSVQAQQKLDTVTKKTVIVWDLDDVLIKAPSGFTKVWSGLTNLKAANRVRKLKKMYPNASSAELQEKAKQRGQMDAVKFIRKMIQKKKVKKDTLKVVKKVHQKGITLYVGTNMGTNHFSYLCKKHSLFKKYFNLKHPQTVDYTAQDIIKKPDTRFFDAIIANNNLDLATTNVIFIDDKLQNVRAAKKVGMIGIHFKNAKQLEHNLKAMNVL